MPDSSRYNTFLESYNKGINQYLDVVSGSFFDSIQSDADFIKAHNTSGDLLSRKISQLDEVHNNTGLDNFTKLKLTGKILMDIVPSLMSENNPDIRRSGANMLNGFFEVAKQTEDEELLRTAANISNSVKETKFSMSAPPVTSSAT